MRRVSDEEGINAGARNLGRLALSLIPWALAIGAAGWLGVSIGVHDFKHQLSQEKRAAIYVGAEEPPKEKMIVDVAHKDCTTVTRADFDGESLVLYGKNGCGQSLDYLEWHWQLISPNNTVIAEGYTNQCPIPRQPGDASECVFSAARYNGLPTDERARKLRVWTFKRW